MGRSRDLADGKLTELLDVEQSTGHSVQLDHTSTSGYSSVAWAENGTIKAYSAHFGTTDGSGERLQHWVASNAPITFGTNNTERMRIDSSGRVTMPYQPSFRAFKTSSWSTGNSVITGWSTFHNTGNHLNTSTGVFTAPVAGVYQVSFHWLSDNTTTQSDVHIRLNNAPNNGIRTRSASSGGHQTTSGSQSIYMSANDTLNFFFESGDKVYMDASQTWTSWSVTLLG